MDAKTIIAALALLLALVAGLTKIASVFDEEWKLGSKLVFWLARWLGPFSFGVVAGMQTLQEWKILKPYLLVLTLFGLVIFLFAKVITGIDAYNRRGNTKEPD